jgi:peptide/nickel transport system ATP-binding protein
MTQSPVAPPPVTGIPLLEARGVTKHFEVHESLRAARRGRARLAAARRAGGAEPGSGQPDGGRRVVHALENVSIALPAAQVTAVVGESGSGKSTLARVLARLIPPTAGEVLLGGRQMPSGSAGRREYARQVQLVLQDPFSSLNPVHSVAYHLTRPLKIHGTRTFTGATLDDSVNGLLARVSLTPPDLYAAKYPHELSGGQRQRVAIARALAVQPQVLLADEPVSMLDVSIRLGLLNLLADLRDREGLAILYITHDIASARYLADTIVVMYAGQVVESGPAGDITDQPEHPYTKLLLSAAPDPERAAPPALAARGAPPSLVSPPSGCRFHPRCPFAMAVCASTTPEPITVRPGHTSACWLHASGLTAAQARPLAGTAGAAPAGNGRHPDPVPAATDPGEETR